MKLFWVEGLYVPKGEGGRKPLIHACRPRMGIDAEGQSQRASGRGHTGRESHECPPPSRCDAQRPFVRTGPEIVKFIEDILDQLLVGHQRRFLQVVLLLEKRGEQDHERER